MYLVTPSKETLIFERVNDVITVNKDKINKYSDAEKEFWNFFVNSVKSDKLILTHASQLEINKDFASFDHIRSILNWFKNSLTIVYPNSKSVGIHFELLKNEDLRLMFSKFLSYFDVNITLSTKNNHSHSTWLVFSKLI